jgi:hypothetical protein
VAARKTLEKMGIHSIPNFVIGGQYVVSGAVHSDELVQIFRTVEKNGRGAPDGAFAETLGIPIEMRETTMPAPDDAPRGA